MGNTPSHPPGTTDQLKQSEDQLIPETPARAAQRPGLPAGRLAIAVAMVANATSFLLPTSNITNLLLLGRAPLTTAAYVSGSWLPWILVTTVTLGPLTIWAGRSAAGQPRPVTARPLARAVYDLIPIFLIASAIRALLGTHLTLHGSFAGQLSSATALASAVGNLPAAAAMLPARPDLLWAAIIATTVGPNLLITGSVATLITRLIARDSGVKLSAPQFSVVGAALVPLQLAAATLGLNITGVLR